MLYDFGTEKSWSLLIFSSGWKSVVLEAGKLNSAGGSTRTLPRGATAGSKPVK